MNEIKRKKLLRSSTKENQINTNIIIQNESCNSNDATTQSSTHPFPNTNLPKNLSAEEKQYLIAVRKGDLADVERIIRESYERQSCVFVDVNCVDSLGRSAINLAIENENLEMLELLIVMGVEPKDALLHAINAEFVEAVELLLEYEELIYVEGGKYSWEKVNWNAAVFTPDITPLILAAHKNNFEILKILLERGATIPKPHHIGCGCSVCAQESRSDSLRHSMSRVNEYRALASPSLISLTSNDPILTAFKLSWELRKLAKEEKECHKEYTELSKRCQQFAVDLLDQTRSSEELAVVLNHEKSCKRHISAEDFVKLPLLHLAIKYKQKRFIAHPHVQQLLSKIWYDGFPGFRSKSLVRKCYDVAIVAVLFPVYCISYILLPDSELGLTIKKPIMKFLIHVTSYLFFLCLLILVSQRAEVLIVEMIGTERMKDNLLKSLQKQRGNAPTFLEWNVFIYVLGYIKQQILELKRIGVEKYARNSLWNAIEVVKNIIYALVIALRIYAYVREQDEIRRNPNTAFIPREKWKTFDPQLIAEGFFATANILSALKLIHMFSVNSHLGPLQISLGRIFIDIVKFFSIYALVLFSFGCGLNQLLWYYAALERKKCYILPDDAPDWENAGESCSKWRSFGNLFESLQTLFWTGFGEVGVNSFDLAGINSYTRFWALLMFAAYSVLNVTVLLNLLIAMMSNSYSVIADQADVEWKFARTKLWVNFFEEKSALPPPYNIIPTKKNMKYLLSSIGVYHNDVKAKQCAENYENSAYPRSQTVEENKNFSRVMRALVWRYVSAKHRAESEINLITEDHVQEIRSDICALKHDIYEILDKRGSGKHFENMPKQSMYNFSSYLYWSIPCEQVHHMNLEHIEKGDLANVCADWYLITCPHGICHLMTDITPPAPVTKKLRMWERRLMKDFHVRLITKEYSDQLEYDSDTVSAKSMTANGLQGEPNMTSVESNSRNTNTIARKPGSVTMTCIPTKEEIEEKLMDPGEHERHQYHQRTFVSKSDAIRGVTAAATAKWKETISEAYKSSQIGKCNSQESLKKQAKLQAAITQAKTMKICTVSKSDSEAYKHIIP